jgi:hypothetical protein
MMVTQGFLFFPRFSSWGKSSHHKFGKERFGLCLGVYDPWAVARLGECKRIPFDLDMCAKGLSPQMKFRITPLIWLHILGLGFQQAAKYHIEEINTWLATRILSTRERLHLPQAIIFPFKVSMNFSKLASVGSRKPIWMPKYRTPCP